MSIATPSLLKRFFRFLVSIGAEPGDTPEILTKKKLVIVNSFAYGLLFIFVVSPFYFHFHESVTALLYFLYGLLTILGLAAMIFKPGIYQAFVFFTMAVGILGTLAGTMLLGGILNSSGMPFWGLIAVLRAMIHSGPKKSLYWFVLYLAVLVTCVILDPFLRPVNNVPHRYVVGLLIFNMTFVSCIGFVALFVFVKQRDEALRLLQEERQKSETLLLNILPREIAATLKNDQGTIAEHYEHASILFADVVNFTPLSNRLTPTQIVELLNEVFSHFDTLVEKHGLEKIKTIGDCYMVAAGVPRVREDHAKVLTKLALEINDFVRHREFPSGKLSFRIGINSGPVVAGVIGKKKFIYDLWGDVVNTASRMESQGIEGGIQITEATHKLIEDDFMCLDGGMVNVKGKGEMKVWHVMGEKTVA